jgi:hypothetical protein
MSKNERVTNPGEPVVGGNVPVRNLSGETPTVGATVKPRQRDSRGRYRVREARLVGPLTRPEGPGGIDSVTGQWVPGVRNNAQLHDLERVHAVASYPYYQVPDFSPGRARDVREQERFTNRILDCGGVLSRA